MAACDPEGLQAQSCPPGISFRVTDRASRHEKTPGSSEPAGRLRTRGERAKRRLAALAASAMALKQLGQFSDAFAGVTGLRPT